MRFQIKVASVGYAFYFFPAERKFILNINRALGVVSALFRRLLLFANVLQTEFFIPCDTILHPLFEYLFVITRLYEILQFHLLKFAGSEHIVLRIYLIPESPAYLGNAKRHFYPHRINDIFEIHKYSGGGLGAKVSNFCRTFNWADKCL